MDMAEWQKNAEMRLKKTSLLVDSILKREYTPRGLALLFLVATAFGFLTKSLVHDSWTMGFDDYRLSENRITLDLNLLQKELLAKGGTLATSKTETPRGDSCSEKTE